MSGGILGGMGPNQGNGILGNLSQALVDNSGLLMGFGGGGFEGAMQGMQVDQRTRLINQQKAEEEQRKVALQQAAQKLGIDPVLAQATPELVGSVAARKYAPKELSFEERQFNLLKPDQQEQYRQSKFLGGDKPTDEMREYAFDMQQRRAAGQPVLPFGEWKTELKRAGAVRINNTVGGEITPLRKKLDEKEGEAWSAQKEAAATSGSLQQDFQVLDELMKTAPQGPVAGRLAEAFPGVSTSGAAFQSVVKRVAPTLRTPGSGATSDIEYEGMLQSLPRLGNKPEANQLIAETMKAKAELNVRRGQIITEFQNGRIDEATARQKLDDINRTSIMSPRLKSLLGAAGGADATRGSGVTTGGVKWSVD